MSKNKKVKIGRFQYFKIERGQPVENHLEKAFGRKNKGNHLSAIIRN